MSANQAPRQVSPADLARSVVSTSTKLAVVAAVCMLLFLVLPAAYVSGAFMGISSERLSSSGSQMGGWTAWLAFVVFAAAAATRLVPSIAQYRRVIDLLAFGMIAAVVIYAFVASPIAAAYHQMHQVQAQLGGLLGGAPGQGMGGGFGRNLPPASTSVSFTVLPHIGVLFFVLAPVFLFLARRRELIVPVPGQAGAAL